MGFGSDLLVGGGVLAVLLMSAMSLQCAPPSSKRAEEVRVRVGPVLEKELAAKDLVFGSPVFMRIFKESRELEVWVEHQDGKFRLFKSYAIAAYSGSLGPKLAEGDGQAPEGFYHVPAKMMHPTSSYHLAFNLGYPNAYDRAHGRTGSFLMVHGNRVSIGCYAMTDARIEEIYTLADVALRNGQKFFRVHCFPFRMTTGRLGKLSKREAKWGTFWASLKGGYDYFETRGVPPNVTVKEKRYAFWEAD
ncbi:MAG: murein L,D-transpeptidase family protein [Verrucomicrobiales bacterium]|nr:2-dehydro-3-deoxyphosphooctonate aldolase [Verrucomicrobiaceae bacterium]